MAQKKNSDALQKNFSDQSGSRTLMGFLQQKTAHIGGLFAFKNNNVYNGWRGRFEKEFAPPPNPPELEVAIPFSLCQYFPKALDSPPRESDKTGLTFPVQYQRLILLDSFDGKLGCLVGRETVKPGSR